MRSWDDVRRRLEDELIDLVDEEFVVVGEPQPPAEPRQGLLRRRARPDPTRYVQVRRAGEHLVTECVGAASFGGDWEVDEPTHDRLRALGWLVPGDPDPVGVAPSYPNYWSALPRSEAAHTAAMCAGALEILGADADSLEWRRDR